MREIEVNSDCAQAINLLTRGNSGEHPFKDVIEETRNLLLREWEVIFNCIYRENSLCAAGLETHAQDIDASLCTLEQPHLS